MSDTPNDPAKKIIIDEDWKARVEAEREEERKKEAAASAGGAEEKATARAKRPLPRPSLTALITTLALQAMMSLGLVADPKSGPPQPDIDQARHLIDMLQMLEDKTSGNRTPDEDRLLDNTLHDLRMAYVSVQNRPAPERGA
jgi:hypothetical protein